jgi:hypothetical protein
MSDYELYGDYNKGEDEDFDAPPPYLVWRILGHLFRALLVCILLGACVILGFRIILSHYYPKQIKRLYYTEALSAYAAAGGDMSALTQDIRVPFEAEILETDGEELQVQTQQKGYYYADNLIVLRGAGALQCSIRLNRHSIEEIAEEYALTDFSMGEDAFSFTLVDNLGRRYTPSAILVESKLLYHYVKLCFDGVDFDGAEWMRVEVTPRGADVTSPTYRQIAVCIYENHESYSKFSKYTLKKSERYLP